MTTTHIAAGPLDVTVRAQFERWYSNEGKWSNALERHGDGYKYQGANHAWHVWQAAVKTEREACAKVCEALWQGEAAAAANGTQEPKYHDAIECAYAIRERSNAEVTGLRQQVRVD